MFNEELARRALDKIKERPSRWNQGSYRSCFAAYVLRAAGYRRQRNSDIWYHAPNGELEIADYAAARLLGLHFYDAFASLFAGGLTIEEIEYAIDTHATA